jgi:pectin methylesterase-like acyl-CoA thioesterase
MRQNRSVSGFCKTLLSVIAVLGFPLACSSSDSAGGGGGSTATGGSSKPPGTGGTGTTGATGGTSAADSGGVVGSGGSGQGGTAGGAGGAKPGSGGSTGTGGAPKNDGSADQAGAPDSGPTGGSTGPTTGTGGKPGSGGSTGAGGVSGSGGATTSAGSGGASSPGGNAGSGGKVGSGGATAQGGSGTGGGTGAGGAGDSSCPPGITQTITVAKDGSGQFSSVQEAVNSVPSGSSTHVRIDIKAGTYTEKLTIAGRTNLCLVGAGSSSTILAFGDSNSKVGSTSGSASVYVSANDFSAANLTVQNTFGSGSQAVALRTTGQRQQFLNCRFVGYQDTLYTHSGMQYFRNCYVQGNTDYVFGGATAVLEDCETRNVENGSAVAAPNTDAGTAYGIVFLGGKFTAVSGIKSVALGRPWGAAGFAAFLNVDLGSHILAAGFVDMSGNSPQNARFHEFGSTGSGANASSRSSYQLSASQAANYTLANILGSWTPSYSK